MFQRGKVGHSSITERWQRLWLPNLAVVPFMATAMKQPGALPRLGAGTATAGGPLVAHVRDFATGEIAFLVGSQRFIVRDPDLAVRLHAAAAKSAEAQSVEGSLAIQNLVGSGGRGYYFRATDRAPKPGEWKYLTQGMIRAGTIALAFTILTNDGQASIEKAALEVIRLAVQKSGEAV